MKKLIFTPWGLVFLSLLFLCLGLGSRLLRYGSASAFIGFGCLQDRYCLAQKHQKVLPSPAVVFSGGGYDGQFYYYLATDIGGGRSAFLDDPRLRKSRIGFPLLLSIFFRFGDAKTLLWAIILLPILLHLFSVYQTAKFFQAQPLIERSKIHLHANKKQNSKLQALALLCLSLNPFVLLSASLGLADAWAATLAFLALLVSTAAGLDSQEKEKRHKRQALRFISALLIALAFLSKETSLAFYPLFLVLLCYQLPKQLPGKKRVGEFMLLAAMPLLVLFVWWLTIDFVPWQTAGRHAGRPFSGIFWFLNHLDAFFSGRTCLLFLTTILLWLLPLWGLRIWQNRKLNLKRAGLAGLLFANLFLVTLATEEYWMNFANIARLFLPVSYLPTLALLLEQTEENRLDAPTPPSSLAWQDILAKTLLFCLAGVLLLLDSVLIRDALFGKLPNFTIWP